MEFKKYFPKNKSINHKFYLRIFPSVDNSFREYLKFVDGGDVIYVKSLQKSYFRPVDYWKFQTNGIFWNTNQKDVYDTVIPSCIDLAMSGFNTVLMGYGQTGSGKTYTMNGLYNEYEQRGIGPRIIEDLLKTKLTMMNELKIELNMSYIEIRGNAIFDLLKDYPIRVTKNDESRPLDNIYIVNFDDEASALQLLFTAEGKRETAKKDSPYNSSHVATSVLTFLISCTSLIKSYPVKTVSKIHVIDMAGMDICGKPTCQWKSCSDIGQGNLIKSQLEQFLTKLGNYSIDPCKLQVDEKMNLFFSYLKDSLTTKCLLRFIAHIKTEEENLDITLSALRFGQTVSCLKSDRIQPKIIDNTQLRIENLVDEINSLKKELYLNAIFFDRDLGLNITQTRVQHMEREIKKYLQDESTEIPLLNVVDASVSFKILKTLLKKMESDRDQFTKEAFEKAYDEVNRLQAQSHVSGTQRSNVKSKRESLTSKLTSKKKRSTDMSPSVISSVRPHSESKAGIGIGSSKSKNYDSNVAKSLKTLQSEFETKSIRSKIPETIMSKIDDFVTHDIPDYEEAWESFLADKSLNASTLNERKLALESNIKDVENNYLLEVEQLYNIKYAFENFKTELLKVQMLRHLSGTEEYDSEGMIKPSEKEIEAKVNVMKYENKVKAQSDVVKTKQMEIKTFNDEYRAVKNEIAEMFNEFCMKNYNTLAPEIKEDVQLSLESDSKLISMENMSVVLTEREKERAHYANNKKYLEMAAKEKKCQDFIRHRKWKTDYK